MLKGLVLLRLLVGREVTTVQGSNALSYSGHALSYSGHALSYSGHALSYSGHALGWWGISFINQNNKLC